MRTRPLAATTAATLALCLAAGSASAGTAAVTAKPARSAATSSATLLSLALAGHTLKVGGLALTSDTLTGSSLAKIIVTPLLADGTAYGRQTITPTNSPASVPTFDSASVTPAALTALARLQSPVFTAKASNTGGAHSQAGSGSYGSLSLLGLPVKLNGTSALSSTATGVLADGQKTLSIKNLALPSIADLLAALGLDLTKLPTATLTSLVTKLGLLTGAITTAQQALDTAEAAVKTQLDAANATLTGALATAATDQQAVTAADKALADAQASLTAANAKQTLDTATLSAALGTLSIASYEALPQSGKDLLGPVVAADYATYLADVQAVTTATSVLAAATAADALAKQALTDALAAVDAAKAALAAILATLSSLITTLVSAVMAALDSTPLLSIDSLTLQTVASATSAKAGGQTARVTGGELTGLHVLGTDVLTKALGTSSVNVLNLVGGVAGTVNGAISTVTGTLSSVLSGVTALPTLSVPAPTVKLLTKTASTDITGGFGNAENSVSALSIGIPALSIPSSVALPGALGLAALPKALSAHALPVVGGLLSTSPITLSIATLADRASFAPGVAGKAATVTPATVTPASGAPSGSVPVASLPRTGLPVGVAVLSLVLLGGGLVLRRRSTVQE